jgi:hypothetical protein
VIYKGKNLKDLVYAKVMVVEFVPISARLHHVKSQKFIVFSRLRHVGIILCARYHEYIYNLPHSDWTKHTFDEYSCQELRLSYCFT